MSEFHRHENQPAVARAKSLVRWALSVVVWVCVLAGVIWASGAIYFLPMGPDWTTIALTVAYVCGLVVLAFRISNLTKLRAFFAISTVAIYLLSLQILPSNDRQWAPDQANVAEVSIERGLVQIDHFRNNVYRSDIDYDVHFESKQFRLARIQSAWFIVQRFSKLDGMAHVFLSFELAPEASSEDLTPEYFSLSVEIRREQGEAYDPIRGLYRCYEITHVIGDERDLIGVRTVHRPDDRVYLFQINSSPEQAQELFARFAKRINKLADQPEFYHSLLNNCANGITRQAYQLTPEPINWLDYRVLFPGYSGDLAFQKGLIGNKANGETFKTFEALSRIDARAKEVGITDSFSQDMRDVKLD